MIEVRNLVKDYGPKRAVNGVSFKVQRGDILGFLGPNGAGKSTTMKMITGFLSPTAGTALVDGHDVTREPVAVKRKIGYLPENAPAYGEMTVEEFLLFIAECRGYRDPPRKPRMSTGSSASPIWSPCATRRSKPFPRATSSAWASRRRCCTIPRCLCSMNPLTASIPNQKNEVRGLIKSMAAEKAVILSTHILEEVEAICTRVIIISQGKVVVDETPAEFQARQPGARLDEIFRTLTQSDT